MPAPTLFELDGAAVLSRQRALAKGPRPMPCVWLSLCDALDGSRSLFFVEKKGGQVVGTLKSIEHIKLIAFKNTVET